MKKPLVTVQELVLCALFAALSAIGAFIKIPGPLVVFTLQTLFTTLAVFLLGRRLGTFSIIAYLFIGLCGLPVFTQGGGPQYVLQPTFGYLLGFAVGAWVCGLIIEKGFKNKNSIPVYILAGTVNIAIIYTIGTIYFCFIKQVYLGSEITDLWAIIVSCALIFIPTDILSVILAAVTSKKLRPIVTKIRLSNVRAIEKK